MQIEQTNEVTLLPQSQSKANTKGLRWSKKRPPQRTKKKEKELPNTPFNFGVIPISLLLLVLPHLCLAKTFLLLFNNFIHSHTHTCIHTKQDLVLQQPKKESFILFVQQSTHKTQQNVVLSYNNNPDRNNQPHAREFCTTYLTNYSHSFTMMVVQTRQPLAPCYPGFGILEFKQNNKI